MAFTYKKLDHPDIIRQMFHPGRENPSGNSHSQPLALTVKIDDSVNVELRLHLVAPEDPHILFFHGNGEIPADYDNIAKGYLHHNINFIVAGYRGYGASGGIPSASSMMCDCHTVYGYVKNWLAEEKRSGPLVVMGRSMGSASAIELSHSYPKEIVALIIESGFALTMPVLRNLGVDVDGLGLTELDGFKNIEKIRKIEKPTLILHGQFDEIIPVLSAELLQAESGARNKQFQMIPGANHNNIIEKVGDMYYQVICQFITKITNKNVRRRR